MEKYRVYDSGFRGKCPSETAEQSTFFARIRRQYPETWGLIATHIRNEGQRTIQQAQREKVEGMVKGASDIVIPANPAFICELKQRDKTSSRISKEQKKYLTAATSLGAFACLAYGCDEAERAFNDYLKLFHNRPSIID